MRTERITNSYIILNGNYLDVNESKSLKWFESKKWIQLAQNRDQLRAVIKK